MFLWLQFNLVCPDERRRIVVFQLRKLGPCSEPQKMDAATPSERHAPRFPCPSQWTGPFGDVTGNKEEKLDHSLGPRSASASLQEAEQNRI